MRVRNALYLLLLVVLSSFAGPIKSFKKLDNGVLVELEQKDAGDPQYVKLQVVSDNIIHVIATPESAFANTQSLMVVDSAGKTGTEWTLSESGKDLVLSTKSLRAKVAGNTGEVTFSDNNGNVILQENSKGYNAFAPVQYGNENTYHLHQAFDATPAEAFYGLGQHQAGLMNYRGWQVDLTQYNSVAVVPFLVSNKNYGILWDNNSITKFGDVRDYQPLSKLKLYNKDQKPGSLTATYAFDPKSGKAPIVRQENEIDYEFLESQQNFPEGYELEGGKITWEGYIESDESGEHHFTMPASGYIKVWVNNELVLDKWREAWNPGLSVFKYDLKKGQKVPFRIEWLPDGGTSYLALRYLTPQPAEEKNKFAFASEAGDEINYYFVNGRNMDEVISGYRTLTGAAQVMPKWAMGFWQSRERYKTQDEILNTVQEFRKRHIPIDNIVLDWSYWKEDQWGSHEFDETRFPDAEGMIKQLHDKYNMHFMISVWPKFYKGTANYKLFDDKGLLYKASINEGIKDWIGKGYVSTFYDAFNPEGRKLFWDLIS